MTSGVLDVAEIVDLFPSSYVLVDSCKFSEDMNLTHGRVVCSSDDESAVYDALRDHPNSLIIFTGPTNDDAEGAYLDRGSVWEAVST